MSIPQPSSPVHAYRPAGQAVDAEAEPKVQRALNRAGHLAKERSRARVSAMLEQLVAQGRIALAPCLGHGVGLHFHVVPGPALGEQAMACGESIDVLFDVLVWEIANRPGLE